MRLIFSLLLLGMLFCKCRSTKNNLVLSDDSNIEIIQEIFSYLSENKFGHHLPNKRECTVIYPKLKVLENSAYYNIWHYHFFAQRDTLKKDGYLFYDLKNPEISLDTNDLKKKVFLEESLKKVKSIGNHCIRFYEEGDDVENVLNFSPLVKINKKDHYHMALSVTDDWDDADFLFLLKKETNGKFKVLHHIWGDDWPGRGIGDQIDILKQK